MEVNEAVKLMKNKTRVKKKAKKAKEKKKAEKCSLSSQSNTDEDVETLTDAPAVDLNLRQEEVKKDNFELGV